MRSPPRAETDPLCSSCFDSSTRRYCTLYIVSTAEGQVWRAGRMLGHPVMASEIHCISTTGHLQPIPVRLLGSLPCTLLPEPCLGRPFQRCPLSLESPRHG